MSKIDYAPGTSPRPDTTTFESDIEAGLDEIKVAAFAGLINRGGIRGIPKEDLASASKAAKYVNEGDSLSFWRLQEKLESGKYFRK